MNTIPDPRDTDPEQWANSTIWDLGYDPNDWEIPIYGSREWLALTHESRLACAIRAAEQWRREGTPDAIAARLRDELATIDTYIRYRLAEVSHDVSAIMTQNGVIDRTLNAHAAPRGRQLLAFYERRARELAATLDHRPEDPR